ncbi:MAG: sulfatase-like hydrolase/transferase [Thermoanaerobaculia bacterium]|nr:sulfatase-like hydrolase/transferase [Thermoanaerobaculia bacterium]
MRPMIAAVQRTRPVGPITLTLALGLAVALLVVAWTGVRASFDPLSLAVFSVIYAILATAVTLGARWLSTLGSPGRVVAALGTSSVLLWQVRELTGQPGALGLLVLAVVVGAAVLWPLISRLSGEGHGIVDLLVAVGLLILVAAGVVAVYRGSPLLRWHLLRHNTLLGTPAYYSLGEPVEEVRDRLLAEHQASGQLALETGMRSDGEPSKGEASDLLEESEVRPPNIVFILLDTLRRDALAGWGGDPQQMPQLNATLERAWRLTDVWSAATWTRPAVATLFTGLQPEAHGARMIEDGLAQEHWTLAEELRTRGYSTTALVTNWGAVGAEVGFDQGFDTFRELRDKPYARAGTLDRTLAGWLGTPEAESALARPTFLYLHFLDPHEPYLAEVKPRRRSAGEMRRGYRSELAYLDQQLASVLDRLASALPGPTIFVLASDHGEEFFEHELFGHGFSLYEEVLSVPVAVWGEGITGGELNQRLEGRDIHDLVLALAKRERTSVSDWTAAHHRERRYASIYYSSEGRLLLRPYLRQVAMRAIQSGDEKLIWSAYGKTWELYDLEADPGESDNLIRRRGDRFQALSQELEDAVDRWRPGTPIELSEEALEQLRTLGYVD